jgi:hypothetical protein
MTGKHHLVNSSFYLDAMTLITDKLQAKNQTEPTFFIFSDDMNSVKNEFRIETVVNEMGVAGAYELIVVGGRNFTAHFVPAVQPLFSSQSKIISYRKQKEVASASRERWGWRMFWT